MDQKQRNALEWDIDKTDPGHHDDLVEGLSGIVDPELGFSILELGLVRNISIEKDQVKVIMILTTPFCPYGPTLLEAARAKVEEILSMKTNIEYGQQSWDPTLMDRDLTGSDWGLFP